MTDSTNAFYPPQYPNMGGGAGVDPYAHATGNVPNDLPCRKCSYNLRSLPVTGRCPECGTPVGVSLQGDLLRFSEPTWVDTLRRGISLILAGIAVTFLMIIGGIAIGFSGTSQGQIQLISGLGGLVAGVLFWAGGWFLTAPDPSGIGEDQYGTSRKIIRFTLLVAIANNVLNIFVQNERFTQEVRTGLVILGVIAAIIGVVGHIAQLQYLSKLALRIPDIDLSKRAHFLMWAVGISYGAVVLLGLISVLIITSAARTGQLRSGVAGMGGAMGIGCFAGVAGLCLLVFGIMYLLMLEKFGRRLKEQVAYAKQTWAANAGPPRPAV